MNRVNTLYRVQARVAEPQLDETSALGLLQHLDKDMLQLYVDNESKLDELVDDLQQVKDLEVDREMLMASNKSLAELNLRKQPDLERDREMLTYTYSETEKLKEEFDLLRSIIESRMAAPNFDSIHAILLAKAAQTEEATERIYESFLGAQLDCDSFVDQYIEQRARYHAQKIKCEKLAEIIQSGVLARQQQPLPPPRPAAPFASQLGSMQPPPYPM